MSFAAAPSPLHRPGVVLGLAVESINGLSNRATAGRIREADPRFRRALELLRGLLGLSPDVQRLTLRYSPMRGSPEDLHVNSRSMLQILQGFASFVEVPEEDVRAGRAAPSAVGSGDADLGRIRSGAAKPDRAYAAVRYRDRWYWIEDGDYRTKRALTAVVFFFTLADTGGADRLPLVTIPAQ